MVLQTTYFGPVWWYRALLSSKEPVFLEAHENFVKQTERSRCRIATANGVQTLTVPVSVPSDIGLQKEEIRSDMGLPPLAKSQGNICQIRISDHGNWRHQHWEALKTAYGMSPFFEYYADDIRPFFEPQWEYLFDFNLAITRKMLALVGSERAISLTEEYQGNAFSPQNQYFTNEKSPATSIAEPIPYYQTFHLRHGFIPHLSILDLLFNEGPEAIKYLR